MSNYPPLRLAVLSGLVSLKERIDGEPNFLDSPECPYDNETRAILKKLLEPKIITTIVEKEVTVKEPNERGRPGKDVRLSAENQSLVLEGILDNLKNVKALSVGDGLETGERIQIAKTQTQLLDQLLKMQERFTTSKMMDEFISTVMGLLNDLITEADRTIFLKRLEKFR